MNDNVRFIAGRQINYPDLAQNIWAFVYTYKVQKNEAGISGLLALDVAYRQASKTYEKYSEQYRQEFAKRLEVA
tara:strand:- start:312 stop:533 length:222 start_codon:yes stop_codon:yes gene_type:complete